ncbi:MAG: formyltransferase family protein [Flavobacteriales bacterium]|nr:phosphoribosylglycinamide formyltransferase [Flavobacteriales bacterium]MCX7767612.1 formyltransferase family protein [Flavobacteriales bacterium]MDW8409546.1 formyltransferase family protein [Flavobacteriales bacterium]
MFRLAIWASGKGSNAVQLWQYFASHPSIQLPLLITSRSHAPVVALARHLDVEVWVYPDPSLDGAALARRFRDYGIGGHLLAGYLRPVPSEVVHAYHGRILNIHPALLPRYGGQGMYGLHVHKAVLQGGERWSGISIHLVTEEYDKGPILFQAQLPIPNNTTAEQLALLIKPLEHACYGPVAEAYFCSLD